MEDSGYAVQGVSGSEGILRVVHRSVFYLLLRRAILFIFIFVRA